MKCTEARFGSFEIGRGNVENKPLALRNFCVIESGRNRDGREGRRGGHSPACPRPDDLERPSAAFDALAA